MSLSDGEDGRLMISLIIDSVGVSDDNTPLFSFLEDWIG
jgi:hypothetical protein